MKYGKELRCLNTKGKYGKVTDTEIKWSIISKSVMTIIFVEFIAQFIDYPINRASLTCYRTDLFATKHYNVCMITFTGISDKENVRTLLRKRNAWFV